MKLLKLFLLENWLSDVVVLGFFFFFRSLISRFFTFAKKTKSSFLFYITLHYFVPQVILNTQNTVELSNSSND